MKLRRSDPEIVLTRLREDTRAEHCAIERTLAELTSDTLTHDRYRFRLGQLYGFYRPLEAQLARVLQTELADFPGRMKTHLLRADLDTLNTLNTLDTLGGHSADSLPICTQLPALDDTTAGFGCLYVLEGSTLGGQFITRHVRAQLGVTPEQGGRFFAGYGRATSAMWRTYRAALVEHATHTGRADSIVDAALATFTTLRQWCERTPEIPRGGQRDG